MTLGLFFLLWGWAIGAVSTVLLMVYDDESLRPETSFYRSRFLTSGEDIIAHGIGYGLLWPLVLLVFLWKLIKRDMDLPWRD